MGYQGRGPHFAADERGAQIGSGVLLENCVVLHHLGRQIRFQGRLGAKDFNLRLIQGRGHGLSYRKLAWALGGVRIGWFDGWNVLFHDLDVDVVVEVYDVFLLVALDVDLQVNLLEVSQVSVQVWKFVYYVVESYLKIRLYLANIVNGTHDKLVQMSVNHQLGFSA